MAEVDSTIITETSKPVFILYGPFAGRVLILREDAAAAAEADGWGVPYEEIPVTGFEQPPAPDYSGGVPESYTTWSEATAGEIPVPPEPVDPVAPTLTSVNPNTAEYGGADLSVEVTGTGFASGSVILFDGGTMPTTFNSETSLSTTVAVSAASVAGAVPVAVKNDDLTSNTVDFTFTEPAPPETVEGGRARSRFP